MKYLGLEISFVTSKLQKFNFLTIFRGIQMIYFMLGELWQFVRNLSIPPACQILLVLVFLYPFLPVKYDVWCPCSTLSMIWSFYCQPLWHAAVLLMTQHTSVFAHQVSYIPHPRWPWVQHSLISFPQNPHQSKWQSGQPNTSLLSMWLCSQGWPGHTVQPLWRANLADGT